MFCRIKWVWPQSDNTINETLLMYNELSVLNYITQDILLFNWSVYLTINSSILKIYRQDEQRIFIFDRLHTMINLKLIQTLSRKLFTYWLNVLFSEAFIIKTFHVRHTNSFTNHFLVRIMESVFKLNNDVLASYLHKHQSSPLCDKGERDLMFPSTG